MSSFSRSKRDIILTFIIRSSLLCMLVFVAMGSMHAHARSYATTPPLGTAGSFAVLAGSTVTNTGPSVVNGNLGVAPGTAVTGFPPGIVNGAIHSADAVALQAQNDATTAYVNAAGQPCNHDLTGQDLGGKTLTTGVYCFSSSAQLTGSLTLNGQGDPLSVFIIQIRSMLTTASNASVTLTNGAQACNVFWQVGSSATIGTGTRFAGNILALSSIAFTTGAISNGGLYARNGAVALDTNTISASPCATITPTAIPTATPTATPTTTPTAIPPHNGIIAAPPHNGMLLTIMNPTSSGSSPISSGATPTSGSISATSGEGTTFEVGHTITTTLIATSTGTVGTPIPQTPIIISYSIPLGEMHLHAIGYGWSISLTSTTSPTLLTATFLGPFPINAGASLPPIFVTGVLTKEAVPSLTTGATIYMPENFSPNTNVATTIFVKKPHNNQHHNNQHHNNQHGQHNHSNQQGNNNDNTNTDHNQHAGHTSNHHTTTSGTSPAGADLTSDNVPGMPLTGGKPDLL